MAKFIIEGGRPLRGRIKVAGNKNAVLPIMAATLLLRGETVLENVPRICDVEVMAQILESLGAEVILCKRTLKIKTDKVNRWQIEPRLAKRLRASVLFLGPLLARFGKAQLPHPGGDVIGRRSIQTHLDGFAALGASVKIEKERYFLKMGRRNCCCRQFLDEPSVTGTENIIMASVFINKEIKIENAASEPHVVDLIDFLNKAGAKIEGGGTNTIKIRGGRELKGVRYRIVPDHIEVGTFAVLGAVTGGEIEISPAIPSHLKMLLLILERFGVQYKLNKRILKVFPSKLTASSRKIQSGPWPSFPTDLMSPFIVLATQAAGETLLHDPMYESRMFFVDKLIRMGAQITICDPHRVIVYGPTNLTGRQLNSPDIRAGMALVLAALAAKGESVIENVEIIERGYEDLERRLSQLGAKIRKI